MTREQALKQAQDMFETYETTRSQVCSFLNKLAASKLLTNSLADSLADTLDADRYNVAPVLQAIIRQL